MMVQLLAAKSTVTQANTKLSITNGVAFADLGATINLAQYPAGSLIVITDSTGKTLQGYIQAAGTTETVGSNILNAWANVGYESGATSGLDITSAINSAGDAYVYDNVDSVASGALVKFTGTLTINSGTAPSARMYQNNDCGGTATTFAAPLSAGVNVIYRSMATACLSVALENIGSLGDWALLSLGFFLVTTTSSTGVTIISARGGATQNWTSETSGFNRNDSSGYTYSVYTEFTPERPTMPLIPILGRTEQ